MVVVPVSAFAQGTAFTYQGRLNDGGAPANGTNYGMVFYIYDAATGGNALGNLGIASMTISNGLFSTPLDFGNVFSGAPRWLEITVQKNGGTFTTLTPRQPLTPTPYAVFAENVGSDGIAAGTYGNAVTFNNAANNFNGTFSGNGAGLSNVNAATLSGLSSSSFWKLGGNTGANPTNGNFIGTTDNLPLEFKVSGARALRFEPNTNGAPNLIGGSPNNLVNHGVVGGTIGGGGAVNYIGALYTNKVTASFGTVGGGAANAAGFFAIVGGGFENTAGGSSSTVGGGQGNTASDSAATVGGGEGNSASVNDATVGGGDQNSAGGAYSTVAGGLDNTASGFAAAVGGGSGNAASGDNSTVSGGNGNTAAGNYSFAAGNRAHADYNGSFVWADSQAADFDSTAANQFLIRAQGGMGIGTTSPSSQLDVVAGFNGDGIHLIGSTSGPRSPAFRLMDGGTSRGLLGLAESDGDFSANAQSGDVVLRADTGRLLLQNSGGAVVFINNNGAGIGRVAAANALEVAGNASKTTAGSWIANSDARIKTDIEPVAGALERLSKVRLVSFRYKDDYRAQHPGIEDRRYLNIIAQEFREVFPDDVKSSGEKLPGDGEAILQADTYPLTIYSAAAIQELNVKLEIKSQRSDAMSRELEQRLAQKETEIADLKQRLEKLERLLERQTATR